MDSKQNQIATVANSDLLHPITCTFTEEKRITAIKKLVIRLDCKPTKSNDQLTTDVKSYDLVTTDSAYDRLIFHMTCYYSRPTHDRPIFKNCSIT